MKPISYDGPRTTDYGLLTASYFFLAFGLSSGSMYFSR
jgi:hypothetical protein